MKILRAAIKTWHAPQNKQIICFLKQEIKLLCEQCPASQNGCDPKVYKQ